MTSWECFRHIRPYVGQAAGCLDVLGGLKHLGTRPIRHPEKYGLLLIGVLCTIRSAGLGQQQVGGPEQALGGVTQY